MLPLNEGVTPAKQLPKEGTVRYHLLKVSKAASLKDLAAEYVFFTHAMLFTPKGGMTHDPIIDFLFENPGAVEPFAANMPREIFAGFATQWASRLMFCPTEGWPKLKQFLGTLTPVDRDRKRFVRVVLQTVLIADLLALQSAEILPSPVPMVDVVVFGLDANDGFMCVAPASNPPMDLPYVCQLPARAETVTLAKAFFAEQPKPFAAIEPTPAEAMAQMLKESANADSNPTSAGS